MSTTHSQTFVDGVPFGDSVIVTYQRLQDGQPTDLLNIGQSALYQLIPDPHRVAVTHTVTVVATGSLPPWPDVEADATVTQAIVRVLDAARSVVQPLPVSDSVAYFLLVGAGEAGGGGASPTWVNPVVVVPTKPGHLTLTCGELAVTLRTPDFGDSDSYDLVRISRQNRGGDLQIFRDPMWPETEVFTVKFSYLDPAVATDFIDFLRASLGLLVTMTDHFGRAWAGYVLTPEGEVVQEKRTTLTASFKFQALWSVI